LSPIPGSSKVKGLQDLPCEPFSVSSFEVRTGVHDCFRCLRLSCRTDSAPNPARSIAVPGGGQTRGEPKSGRRDVSRSPPLRSHQTKRPMGWGPCRAAPISPFRGCDGAYPLFGPDLKQESRVSAAQPLTPIFAAITFCHLRPSSNPPGRGERSRLSRLVPGD